MLASFLQSKAFLRLVWVIAGHDLSFGCIIDATFSSEWRCVLAPLEALGAGCGQEAPLGDYQVSQGEERVELRGIFL